MNIIQKAYDFAKRKHKGQFRDDGKPYFAHPDETYNILDQLMIWDENLYAAAYLHDVIEDCGVTRDTLAKEFNDDVANLVMEVTHEGNKIDGYTFPRLKTRRGIMLKLADRISNLASLPDSGWNNKRKEQYVRKTIKLYGSAIHEEM